VTSAILPVNEKWIVQHGTSNKTSDDS
jgi:hypothetical protein